MCTNLAVYGGIYTRPMTWRRTEKRGKLDQPMAAKEEEIKRPATKWAAFRFRGTFGFKGFRRGRRLRHLRFSRRKDLVFGTCIRELEDWSGVSPLFGTRPFLDIAPQHMGSSRRIRHRHWSDEIKRPGSSTIENKQTEVIMKSSKHGPMACDATLRRGDIRGIDDMRPVFDQGSSRLGDTVFTLKNFHLNCKVTSLLS